MPAPGGIPSYAAAAPPGPRAPAATRSKSTPMLVIGALLGCGALLVVAAVIAFLVLGR